jgi:hypothetical protein
MTSSQATGYDLAQIRAGGAAKIGGLGAAAGKDATGRQGEDRRKFAGKRCADPSLLTPWVGFGDSLHQGL